MFMASVATHLFVSIPCTIPNKNTGTYNLTHVVTYRKDLPLRNHIFSSSLKVLICMEHFHLSLETFLNNLGSFLEVP